MDPVPPHLRTWSTGAYVAYWISDAVNIATWELASSMLAVGLSWYFDAVGLFCNGTSLIHLQARGSISHCCWKCYYCDRHGPQWHNRRPFAYSIPSPQPVILRLLVQLFQRHQSRHSFHVLVWCAGHFIFFYIFLDTPCRPPVLQTYTGSEGIYQVRSFHFVIGGFVHPSLDAQSPVAFHLTPPEPPVRGSQGHFDRFAAW